MRVAYRWLRPRVMGYTEWPDSGPPHIVLAKGIGDAERRVTLAHEEQHVFRGPAPVGQEDADELEVRRLTAMWLLPDAEEFGAVLRTAGLAPAATRLRVTVDVLLDRIRWATQDELDVIADWQPER